MLCPMADAIANKCKHYEPESFLTCNLEDNEKCIMKSQDGYFKSLEEYKGIIKYQINEKDKTLDYATGYIICLKDSHILSLEDSLELLKYTSEIYFIKKGWK